MKQPLSPLNRDWLVARLDSIGEKPRQTQRGDFNLSPDIRSTKPLTAAAVLVPIVSHADTTTVMLTRRTEHLSNHPGQVSFPGGHIESGDGSPEETAIRETEEETGLHHDHIDIVGRLDDYETRTGFLVKPVVAIITPPFDLNPDPNEVAEVFEVPLAFLLDPSNHQRQSRNLEGRKVEYIAMPYNQHFIWGATAGMLVNLYEALENP